VPGDDTTSEARSGASEDAETASSGLGAQIAERRAKREALRAAGIDPYPTRFDRTATLGQLTADHGGLDPDSRTGVDAGVAGKIASIRGHGKLVFVTIRDASGSVQLMCRADVLTDESAAVLDRLDLGDWVGAAGEVISSRRGELSVEVRDLLLLAKALRPLPDRWHGLAEQDTRYRQREVDLLANEDSRRVFEIRFAAVAAMRACMTAHGFVEVETPILQPQAGGALARPFVTHANALDIDLTLRIAPELYLKRLVVGGLERVYEIGRNFRNEGIDTRHSPEFTTLEAYRAFGDYTDGMDLTENLVMAAAGAVGRSAYTVGEWTFDLSPGWPRRHLLELLEERLGRGVHPSDPTDELRSVAASHDVALDPAWGGGRIVFELYDALLMPEITGPMFVYSYPIEVSPLARRNAEDPTMTDRFELVIAGRELCNGYSELNDPDDQLERFQVQAAAAAAGDAEAHPADAAFVRALEYGLPPTAGIGLGIDRLVMLLAEVTSIRDVILFPTLRPEVPENLPT
jgi:lysyl-tRNA synthetase, class II